MGRQGRLITTNSQKNSKYPTGSAKRYKIQNSKLVTPNSKLPKQFKIGNSKLQTPKKIQNTLREAQSATKFKIQNWYIGLLFDF